MKITGLISFRLFVLLFAVLLLSLAVFTYFSIRLQNTHLMDNVLQSATRGSDVILRSTHNSMLLNRREDLYASIRMIGSQPGIEGVRILNKKGEVVFSSTAAEVGHVVDLQEEACIICHRASLPLTTVSTTASSRIYRNASGERLLGVITAVRNSPECSNASCHAHPASLNVLGVLDVKMSLRQVDAQLAESRQGMLAYAVSVVALIAVLTGVFIYFVVQRPVKRLIRGTQSIAGGNLDGQIAIRSDDDMGRLAVAFNDMTGKLKLARDEITEWSRTLEDKVKHKSEELERTQRQLIQMEKLASLGKLSATVAHEINNPLAGILTTTKLTAKQLARLELPAERRLDINRQLDLIASETARCGDIVKNLLTFARQAGGILVRANVPPIIDRSLQIMRHHLDLQHVKLVEELPQEEVHIVCDANQVQQALIALLVNAVEAMPGGGTLTVRLRVDRSRHGICIDVQDTGGGIAPDVLPQIFDPFFSTKKDSKGVGLGLSVAYGIVKRHRGEIQVNNVEPHGALFTMFFPMQRADQDEQGIDAVTGEAGGRPALQAASSETDAGTHTD